MALGDKLTSLAGLKAALDQVKTTIQTAISQSENTLTNEIAEVDGKIGTLQEADTNFELMLSEKVDDAYVEDGYLYLTSNNEIVAGPLGPFSGGGGGSGGGSGNNAVLTVTNETGWLATTIAAGGSCQISISWSSIEDEMPTGNGSMRIVVNGITKGSLDITQGNVTVDLKDYLGSGSNTVRVTVSDVYGNSRTINFSVTAIALSISSSFDTSSPFTGGISFTYTPTGGVSKTIHFILDGTQIGTTETTITGRQLTYSIPAQSHGAHSLRVYMDAEISGVLITSNELYYEFISIDPTSDVPIITSNFNTASVSQYQTVQIGFTVYTPTSMTSAVEIFVNNISVSTQTVDRTQQVFSYRADTVGSTVVRIVSGITTKTISFTVTEVDIDAEAETDSLALFLSSYGRSNNEATPGSWIYDDISATFTGFNYTSDGWQLDDDGITVLRVSGDARVSIPYKPFATDFRSTGKTLEFEFATRDIMNYDSVVLSCLNGGRGVSLTAQKATLRSEKSELSMQYKEDEHVRISFVAEKRSENRLLYIYVNGIMSGVIQYADDDDFAQLTPANITIGSNDCTIDVYCIRIYDNNLTPQQILNNWIADTQDGGQMLERYQHNNVYDEYGQVVIAKLPSDLPYMILEADELPQYKGDKKTISGSYIDPVYSNKSFTFTGAQADVQGTSSQYYARKNYKIKFKNGFVLPSGSTASKYAMNATAVPTNTFCFKADVASSEGANNVELVRLYNDACPYKTPAQEENSNIRQGIDGFPIVIFWHDTTTDNVEFIGKYNFNNDKGTEEVFGFVDGDESWEILNNNSNRVLWKSDDYTGTGWLEDFEARFPDTDPAYTNSANLKAFATWVKSTDQTQATGDDLAASVTYGTGDDAVTYTKDTAAYRLAKFKAELSNYVEMDSTLFYYLFTELFLMVDSRAKNAFPSFIGSDNGGE